MTDNEADGRLAYSVEETARACGISLGLTYELIRQGKIPSIRLGERRLLVPRVALAKMLAEASENVLTRLEQELTEKP